jgi:hypothetical protein
MDICLGGGGTGPMTVTAYVEASYGVHRRYDFGVPKPSPCQLSEAGIHHPKKAETAMF